jgi:hypothetical protein
MSARVRTGLSNPFLSCAAVRVKRETPVSRNGFGCPGAAPMREGALLVCAIAGRRRALPDSGAG